MSAASTIFLPPDSGYNSSPGSTSEADVSVPWAAGGTIKSIYVVLSAAPGVGKSYRFQISVAGAASTQVDVTISGNSTSGNGSGTGAAVVAGNTLTYKVTPSGTPTVVDATVWIEWEPTTANQYVYSAGLLNNHGDTNAFCPLFAGYNYRAAAPSTDTVLGRSLSPIAGTISALYAKCATAPGAGNTRGFVVMRNSAEEATSEFTIGEAATTGNATGLSIAVAVGDTVGFKHKATATGPDFSYGIGFSVCFTPTIAGAFCIGSNNGTTGESAAAARYAYLGYNAAAFDWDATEANAQVIVAVPMSVKGFATEITTAPGASKSHTQQARKNGANGGVSLVFNDAVTLKAQATGVAFNLTGGDLLSLSNTPASTPALSGISNYAIWFGIVTNPAGKVPPGRNKPPGGGGKGGGPTRWAFKALRRRYR